MAPKTGAGKNARVYTTGAASPFVDVVAASTDGFFTYVIPADGAGLARALDRVAAVTVKEDAVASDPATYTLDRLSGRVTFATARGSGVVVTVSGSYLTLALAAKIKGYSLQISGQNVDDTGFEDGGYISRRQALKDVKGSLARRWLIDTQYATALLAGTPVVIVFYSNVVAGEQDLRVWALLSKSGVEGAVEGLVEGSVDFEGCPDQDGRVLSLRAGYPFAAPRLSLKTVGLAGDGWVNTSGFARTAAGTTTPEGIPIDFAADNDAAGTASTSLDGGVSPLLVFDRSGVKTVRITVERISTYASHVFEIIDTTGPTNKLALNVDFSTATPAVTIVGGAGTFVSVTQKYPGVWDILVRSLSVTAGHNHKITIIPAAGTAADQASFAIGDILIWD